jgi:hypothetical protein
MKNATKAIIKINTIVDVEFVFCTPDTIAHIPINSKITIPKSSLLKYLSNFVSIGFSDPDAVPDLVTKKFVATIIVVTNNREITEDDTGLSSIKADVLTAIPVTAVIKKAKYNTRKKRLLFVY